MFSATQWLLSPLLSTWHLQFRVCGSAADKSADGWESGNLKWYDITTGAPVW